MKKKLSLPLLRINGFGTLPKSLLSFIPLLFMQLKSINEKFLPDLMQKEFGKEIFTQLENSQHIAVKGSAGSSVSVFVAELFLVQKKNILYLVDDKEDALYANTEMEDLLGKEKVLYFPATHLEPYQVEKTQNANLVLRTEVLNKINSGRSPKVIVAYAGFIRKGIEEGGF